MEPGEGLYSRTALAIYGCGFFTLGFSVLNGLAVPLWTVELNAPPAITGMVLGVQALLPLIFSIHVGTLMDRTDARLVMLILAIASSVVPLLYPLLPWIPALFALQMVAGLIYQLSWVGAQTLIGRAYPGNPRFYGRFSSAANLGMFLGPLLDGFAWSWLGAWGGFGLMAVWGAGLTVAVFAVPKVVGESHQRLDWRTGLVPDLRSYAATFRLIRIPAISLVVLATFLRICASYIRGSFYTVYLSRDAHLSGSAIGALIAFGSLVGTLGSLFAESSVRLCGSQRRALILSEAAALLFISITPTLPRVWMLAVGIAGYGVGMGVNQPILLAILSSAVGFEYQGAATGLRSTANLVAGLALPISMGFVIEAAGIAHGFYITGAVLLAATALVARFTRDAADPGGVEQRADAS
jgi:MFS family permease